MCGAFKAQGFSWPFPRLVFHIDTWGLPEVTTPQCSWKGFQNISLTTFSPLLITYPAAGSSIVALLGCSVAAQLHEIHSSHDWFPSPGTLLIAQTEPVDEGWMSHELFAGCWHSSVLCKQQEKQEPGQVTPGLGHVCKEKWFLTSSFPQAGLQAYLWSWRLSSKQASGKTPPVLWMLLASFWPFLSSPLGVKSGWGQGLPLSFHISN